MRQLEEIRAKVISKDALATISEGELFALIHSRKSEDQAMMVEDANMSSCETSFEKNIANVAHSVSDRTSSVANFN